MDDKYGNNERVLGISKEIWNAGNVNRSMDKRVSWIITKLRDLFEKGLQIVGEKRKAKCDNTNRYLRSVWFLPRKQDITQNPTRLSCSIHQDSKDSIHWMCILFKANLSSVALKLLWIFPIYIQTWNWQYFSSWHVPFIHLLHVDIGFQETNRIASREYVRISEWIKQLFSQIIGGNNVTTPGKWPWQILTQYNYYDGTSSFAAGSLEIV